MPRRLKPRTGCRAMIVWRRRDRFAPRSPFALFYQLIAERIQERRSQAGAVYWSTFPLQYALASGLWPVLIAIGKQFNKNLATADQVQQIAAKVNQFLAVSLYLIYKTPAEMAAAFQRDVLELIDTSLELGFRPGMQIPNEAWSALKSGNRVPFIQAVTRQSAPVDADAHLLFQAPVALFFFDLLSRAKKMERELRARFEKITDFNTLNSDNFLYWSEIGDEHRRAEMFFELFDLSRILDHRDIFGNDESSPRVRIPGIHELGKMIGLMESNVRLAKALPVRNPRFWELAQGISQSIDTGWVNTQMLLAAADLPDREFIEYTEFPVALKAFQQMELSEVVAKTLRRWQQFRQFQPHEKQLLAVESLLRSRGKKIFLWDTKIRKEVPSDIEFTFYKLPKTGKKKII